MIRGGRKARQSEPGGVPGTLEQMPWLLSRVEVLRAVPMRGQGRAAVPCWDGTGEARTDTAATVRQPDASLSGNQRATLKL